MKALSILATLAACTSSDADRHAEAEADLEVALIAKHAVNFPDEVAGLRRQLDAKVLTSAAFTRDHQCDGLRTVIITVPDRLNRCDHDDDELMRLDTGVRRIQSIVATIERDDRDMAHAACFLAENVVRRLFACPSAGR